MSKLERIKSITSFTESKFKEKGSQFIGQAYPVQSEDEAQEILETVRKKYYDATHHCFCYDIQDGTNKYSDDGEPSGTAGIRILNAINHFELTNLLVISIRYYGGTKLGVGPLGKAYYRSAFETLDAALKIEKLQHSKVKIIFDYNMTSQIHHAVSLFDAININNIFDQRPAIECCILANQLQKFESTVAELSNGNATVKVIADSLYLTK